MAPRWINLYGAPERKQTGVASKMNRGFIEGTYFRGRVLVSAQVVDQNDPKKVK